MSNQQATIGNFHADLKTTLPRLRIYALSLTRDSDRADDLMQRTVVKALTGRKSFQPGTNFRHGCSGFNATNSFRACVAYVRL